MTTEVYDHLAQAHGAVFANTIAHSNAWQAFRRAASGFLDWVFPAASPVEHEIARTFGQLSMPVQNILKDYGLTFSVAETQFEIDEVSYHQKDRTSYAAWFNGGKKEIVFSAYDFSCSRFPNIVNEGGDITVADKNGKSLNTKASFSDILTGQYKSHENIASITRHEVGHALDDALGEISSSPYFIEAYRADMDDETRKLLRASGLEYYLDGSHDTEESGRHEAFAELWAALEGGCGITSPSGINLLLASFPRTVAVISTLAQQLEMASELSPAEVRDQIALIWNTPASQNRTKYFKIESEAPPTLSGLLKQSTPYDWLGYEKKWYLNGFELSPFSIEQTVDDLKEVDRILHQTPMNGLGARANLERALVTLIRTNANEDGVQQQLKHLLQLSGIDQKFAPELYEACSKLGKSLELNVRAANSYYMDRQLQKCVDACSTDQERHLLHNFRRDILAETQKTPQKKYLLDDYRSVGLPSLMEELPYLFNSNKSEHTEYRINQILRERNKSKEAGYLNNRQDLLVLKLLKDVSKARGAYTHGVDKALSVADAAKENQIKIFTYENGKRLEQKSTKPLSQRFSFHAKHALAKAIAVPKGLIDGHFENKWNKTALASLSLSATIACLGTIGASPLIGLGIFAFAYPVLLSMTADTYDESHAYTNAATKVSQMSGSDTHMNRIKNANKPQWVKTLTGQQ